VGHSGTQAALIQKTPVWMFRGADLLYCYFCLLGFNPMFAKKTHIKGASHSF